jgi:phospho-N-acetylmuramoyl-pentapeptide-transferase
MITDLLFLVIAVVLSAVLYPFWINFVYKYHMGEEIRSDGPQTHIKKKGTPTMGGMVFIVVVAIITFSLNTSRTQTLFPLLVASMAALFGVLEDFGKIYKTSDLFSPLKPFFKLFSFLKKPFGWFIELARVVGSSDGKGLQTYQKFLIQGSIAGFVAFWSYVKLGWDYIWFPLLGNIHVGWLYPIIIFFLFMMILNFVAFTDGVDGLAGLNRTIYLLR